MKNNIIKIIVIFIIGIIMPLLYGITSYSVQAKSTFNPDNYIKDINTDTATDTDKIMDMGRTIVSAIRAFGIFVSVAVIIVLGIKYMVGSVEEKAQYKKTMLPYLIGAIMVFSITIFVSIIAEIAKSIK